MPQQDLYIGLGSIAYALAKADGRLQTAEVILLQQILLEVPHGEIALSVVTLYDRYGVKPEEAYQSAFRRFAAHRGEPDEPLKKKFMGILQHVAKSIEGASRQEQEILRRCRKELTRL
jgi:hypothetical protein